MYVQDLIP